MPEALYADATDLLTRWAPTSPASAVARDRTLDLLAAGPVATTRAYRPGHLTASALVLDATGTRLLLCLHGKFRQWMQLGGHCEPGDRTLAAAAVREATETVAVLLSLVESVSESVSVPAAHIPVSGT